MKAGKYIASLTGVRAVAAFMVFFHHYNYSRDVFSSFFYQIFKQFHTGVTIFFVLSGFLITFRYYNASELSSQWFKKYLKNRIARIYPMYFLLTLAAFFVAYLMANDAIYAGFKNRFLVVFCNVFFLRGFFDSLKFSGLSQGWTLTVEECFYFSAPLFFLFIHKNKKSLWIIPMVLIGIGLLLVLVFARIHFYGFFDNYRFMLLYTFNGRCIEFFLGIYLALIVLKLEPIKKKNPWYTTLGVMTMMGTLALMASLPLVSGYNLEVFHPLGIVYNNIVLPIGVTLFFYGLITESSYINRFLSSGIMQILGKSSYIFYLIHIGFIADWINRWTVPAAKSFFEWLSPKHSS